MKPVYNKISPENGAHIAGICKIKIIPREWLQDPLSFNFNDGTAISPINIIAGKDLIVLELIPETYLFDEKPKSSKGGTFYDITISGTTNYLDEEIMQILNTYRNHEFVAIVEDKKHRNKIIGDQDAALIFQFENKQENKQGGTQVISIDLNMQKQNPSPFYV